MDADRELVVLKLSNGEEVVGERVISRVESDALLLRRILKLDLQMVAPGQFAPMLRPWIISSPEQEVSFLPSEVFCEVSSPNVAVREMYDRTFSPIAIAR